MRLPQTTQSLVDRIKGTKPLFEPGQKYEYSNANYWLLAHVIEKLSGVSYAAFLKREIFDPLGMKDTGHRSDALAVIPRLAPGYQPDGPDRLRIAELIDWTSKTGNGSLYSTAADLSRFYHGLRDQRLLSPETTARTVGVGKAFGFGWFHGDDKAIGHRSIRFNGRSPGYSSYLEGFDDRKTSFIILSNLYVYAPTAMAAGVAAILWDKPYHLQEPIGSATCSTSISPKIWCALTMRSSAIDAGDASHARCMPATDRAKARFVPPSDEGADDPGSSCASRRRRMISVRRS